MSNLLKVAMIDLILSLRRRNWSQRRIAQELGINRETVARYLRQAEAAPKPASAPSFILQPPPHVLQDSGRIWYKSGVVEFRVFAQPCAWNRRRYALGVIPSVLVAFA